MLETLKTLCALPGVSGCEDAVREYILAAALAHVDEAATDAMGNLMLYKWGETAGTGPLMLCAHMDEVGLMVTDIRPDGRLGFGCLGGIDRRVLPGKRVLVGQGQIPAVIGFSPAPAGNRRAPGADELFLELGVEGREAAEALVQIGDPVVFDPTVTEMGGLLKAKALDDRLGCAVLLELIRRPLPRDAWFVFTTQEEMGTRGARTAAWRIAPETAIVVEGTTAADLAGVADGDAVCRVGGGVVIPFADGGTIYDRGLFSQAAASADAAGIPWQTKRRIAGGTDAAAIQRSCGGVRVLGLACALRNIHSPACVGSLQDMEYLLELTERMLYHV